MLTGASDSNVIHSCNLLFVQGSLIGRSAIMVRTIYAIRLAFADRFLENSRRRFGDLADTFLKLYPAGSDDEAFASQLAAFRDELAWVMRQWAALQSRTGKSKAYLYYFTHEPPA